MYIMLHSKCNRIVKWKLVSYTPIYNSSGKGKLFTQRFLLTIQFSYHIQLKFFQNGLTYLQNKKNRIIITSGSPLKVYLRGKIYEFVFVSVFI